MTPLVRSMRPAQWVKNAFIFLPLFFGKKIQSFPENRDAVFAFILFSMASSAVYLLNDIWDAESDRRHPLKKDRPIASGALSRNSALIAALVLGTAAVFLSFAMSAPLGFLVASYLALNLLYSRFLKHRVLIDVGCIAVFFLMRIAAGSVVADVQLSHWIIFMTALLALFLGFGKRRQELMVSGKSETHRKVLLQYDAYFIDQMMSVITASIVVVYMLYTVDRETVAHFGTDHLLYTIPFVYYGIFRYLYLVHKANIEGDPTRALFSDIRMQLNIVLWVAVCAAVVYFGL